MSRWITRPLNVVAGTPWTPRRNSGWWVRRRSACQATASSTTASTGSTASSTRRTGAEGSPQTSPTASQSRAHAGSYICSSTWTTWARVAVPVSLVTTTTIVGPLPHDDANVNSSLRLDYREQPLGVVDRKMSGGPGRTRTDDTRGVSAVLYQLSYRPLRLGAGSSQLRDGLPVRGQRPRLPRPVDHAPAQDAGAVDEEGAADGGPDALVEDVVGAGDLAVRPEVGQQRELVLLLL